MGDQQERQPLLNDTANGNNANGKPYHVSFDDGIEGQNPLEWSKKYKWFSVALLCGFAAIVHASTVCFTDFRHGTYTCIGIVPVADEVVTELAGHPDREATVLFVTIWELGEATGPLFIAPLSEIFGRFVVYNVANCLFIAGVAVTALSQNLGLLIFARFATGCAVAANVLNPAIIGDIFPSESRGAAMSAVMLAPLIGGALGPTISGSLAEATGWREIMWLCVGIAGVIEVLFLVLFRETYAPTLLHRIAKKKRQETGDDSWTTPEAEEGAGSTRTLLRSMTRPARIVWSSSLLQLMSLWGGLVFSFFYVNSTSLPDILKVVYGFSPSKRGLSYLAWTLGSCIGLTACNRLMDPIYNRLTKRRNDFYPEGRLPLCIFGAFLLPLAVGLYGGTAGNHMSVFVFLSTVTLLCIAVVTSIVPLMTFITDAFGRYSASALTATLIIRCLMGAFLPLTVPPLSEKVGYGPAFLVLAGVCLLLAPIPPLVMRYGPSWRQKSSFSEDS